MKDQDSIFFRNFSMLLAFLVLLTIVLAVAGGLMHDDILNNDSQAKDRSAISKTIEPIAKVNTGDVMIPVKVKQISKVAFDGSLDGNMIYENVCAACHTTGVAGAPKLEAAAWDGRLAQGIDGLTASVIKGKGAMPPKAGRTDLSEKQINAAVKFMTAGFMEVTEDATIVDTVKTAVTTKAANMAGKIKEVVANKIDAKKIYQTACFACHGTGAAGAPKLVAADWKDRMALGIDGLVASAIKGKGAMPPKGGFTNLSDADIQAAVEFMTKGF